MALELTAWRPARSACSRSLIGRGRLVRRGYSSEPLCGLDRTSSQPKKAAGLGAISHGCRMFRGQTTCIAAVAATESGPVVQPQSSRRRKNLRARYSGSRPGKAGGFVACSRRCVVTGGRYGDRPSHNPTLDQTPPVGTSAKWRRMYSGSAPAPSDRALTALVSLSLERRLRRAIE